MCIHPQQEVGQLDTTHLNYSTIECREARSIALHYDPKNAERLGIGLLLGFLGPVGLVMAVATDAERYQKGEAISMHLNFNVQANLEHPPAKRITH